MKLNSFSLMVIALLSSVTSASTINHQICVGTLELNADGNYALNPSNNSGNGNWCDAVIPKSLVKKVLKACKVGNSCRIEGSIEGHGAFSWDKIKLIKLLEQ